MARRLLIGLGTLSAVVGGAVAALGYMTLMPGSARRSESIPPITPEERELAARLERHVRRLASAIGPRHVGAPMSLRQARDYLTEEFRTLAGGRTSASVRLENLGSPGQQADNILLEIQADEPPAQERPRWLVIGAHYDTEPNTPGANDNGSGVAVALELSRALLEEGLGVDVRIALFANEEQPFFGTEGMGSLVHARAARARSEDVCGMFSLETLGYYSDEPDSQQYPWPIGYFYPSTGNFVAFVANLRSRRLLRRSLGAFRSAVEFPSEGAALPEGVAGVGWSDHWAFWQAGYPALMVTDTAVFRDPNYHQPSDQPGQLDFPRLARVTRGLEAALRAVGRHCAARPPQ